MIIFLQFVLTTLACAGLWRAWSRLAGRGKESLVIAIGFVVRALAGQLLFWISWSKLPIARPLQLGNGFWFFAIDGPGYLSYADTLINLGPRAILFVTTGFKSRLYTQAFTAAVAAFGTVASVAILFNCAAYLATCAFVQRIGPRHWRLERPRLVALAAIAFGPGMILWSLQALKDTFFFFLIAALVWACFRWQELWQEAAPRWRRLLVCAMAIVILTYEIGGTRWYFAAIVWALFTLFLTQVALRARRRSWPLLAAALLFIVLSQAVRLGGGDDIPWQVRRLLMPGPVTALRWWKPAPQPLTWKPAVVPGLVVELREGFERTVGSTAILPGPLPAPLLHPVNREKKSAGPVPAPLSHPVNREEKSASPQPAPLPHPVNREEKFAAAVIIGFAAMFIPRFLGQALGLIRIGGGRGFWLFVETDTLVFDAVLLFAAVYCTRALRSWARATPLFILLVLLFLATALPMMYTVSNFGTLFRLRLMVYLIAAILPLTLTPKGEVE